MRNPARDWPKAPSRRHDDRARKREQQRAANAAGLAFGILGERSAASQLDRQSPDQVGGRRQCQSEGQQCNRMRGDSGANGDGSLDQHLANGDVFEKERLPHQHTAALEECRVRHFTALFRAGITRNGMWTAAPRQYFLGDR